MAPNLVMNVVDHPKSAWKETINMYYSTGPNRATRAGDSSQREMIHQIVSANWLDIARYNDLAPSSAQYSPRAVSIIF